jgi:hypothetical protein
MEWAIFVLKKTNLSEKFKLLTTIGLDCPECCD